MYVYEEIPETQVPLIDGIYESISKIKETDNIKVNGDDNLTLVWVDNVINFIKDTGTLKPTVKFV